MAQIESEPLLCICIPIYNRRDYLERMLTRFMEDADLFQKSIKLIISDNCSQENLEECCKKFHEKGLQLMYHRNETNLGSNGNFLWCFNNAKGKYIWLLGSDDVPYRGVLRSVVDILNTNDIGLLHLSVIPRENSLSLYTEANDVIVAVNYWITFMSSNIFQAKALSSIDLSKYKETWLIQVPAYLNAAFSYDVNAIFYCTNLFENETDAANNGGYGFFQVFVTNLFSIYSSFVSSGKMTRNAFEKVKKIEFKEYLSPQIVKLLIFKDLQRKHFDSESGWQIIRTEYGNKIYSYYYLLKAIIREALNRIMTN